ncbi:MAG: lipopolysaccharide heptosyltransferase II [Endomicrobiales bacterium]|nr:lipopolysaccharide heptosyltransferase II [Endomicrobiales bacterium]
MNFISLLGWMIISCLGKTLRIIPVNTSVWKGRHFIFAFWHGEQFLPFFFHSGQDAVVMSSLSKDGEIQNGILNMFGYKTVRGSSTRGGDKALVEMIRVVKKGPDAGFAVDGPKGPYKKVKPGVIYLAQKTGVPIVPIGSAARKSAVLSRAWDKYELPRPFTRCVICYGKPVEVKRGDDIEKKASELEDSLNEISRFAHNYGFTGNLGDYLSNHPAPKILVIQPSRIGDVVFTLPAVSAIRKRFPKAWIGWFVDERCAELLQGNPDIDEVVVFNRKKASLPYLLGLYKNLREKNIDVSIDFHGLFKSAVMVFLAGARHRIASSSTNGMRELSWLFSREIKPNKEDAHCVERHFAVAEHLGAGGSGYEYKLGVAEPDKNRVRDRLKSSGIDLASQFAVVHPGGGWIARRWRPDRFSKLIEKLGELGIRTVLVGGKEGGASEKGLNEEIISRVKTKVCDLTGELNLKELAALFSLCSVYIANEAGPMHIATAMNVPAVALLGPTDPKRTGPFGGKTTIIRHEVACQPCRKRNCKKRTCMDGITVDEVFETVKAILKKV